VSSHLESVEWNNPRPMRADVPMDVARLKEQSGRDILVFGSRELSSSLFQSGLVDELRLLVYPVVLGSGKRLFMEGSVRY